MGTEVYAPASCAMLTWRSPCDRQRGARRRATSLHLMPQSLQLVLILLATAVFVVVACRLARLPPILGYLLVGIAVGPHALAWIPDNADVRYLAEFGVVFLMFSIG